MKMIILLKFCGKDRESVKHHSLYVMGECLKNLIDIWQGSGLSDLVLNNEPSISNDNGGIDRLLTNEPIAFEKWPVVQVQGFRSIASRCRGMYPMCIWMDKRENQKMSGHNWVDLETLRSWPIMPKILPGHWFVSNCNGDSYAPMYVLFGFHMQKLLGFKVRLVEYPKLVKEVSCSHGQHSHNHYVLVMQDFRVLGFCTLYLEVSGPSTDTFSSAPTSRKIQNTHLVWDD